jgi:hypothetical protein
MATGYEYSLEDKERAVAAYVIHGTYAHAERLTGVKQTAIRMWKERQPAWFEDLSRRIRIEHEEEHRSKIRSVIVTALDQLADRVVNGDFAADKDGNYTIRKPMIGRDLVIASGTMIDKLRLSLGQPTSIAGKSVDTAQDKLASLRQAAQDSAIAQARDEGKLVEMGRETCPDVPSKPSDAETIAA